MAFWYGLMVQPTPTHPSNTDMATKAGGTHPTGMILVYFNDIAKTLTVNRFPTLFSFF